MFVTAKKPVFLLPSLPHFPVDMQCLCYIYLKSHEIVLWPSISTCVLPVRKSVAVQVLRFIWMRFWKPGCASVVFFSSDFLLTVLQPQPNLFTHRLIVLSWTLTFSMLPHACVVRQKKEKLLRPLFPSLSRKLWWQFFFWCF